MPHVSRRRLSDKAWEVIWGRYIEAMNKIDKSKDVDVFMSGILTNTERVMIAKRLMVGILTLSSWDAYAIANLLKMSVATVYKLQRYLELNSEFKRLVKRMFPEKIPYKKDYREPGFLEDIVERIFAGYRDRSKMYSV